jgi:hypothetical protein
MTDLRSRTIRLAHANPDLRQHLIPLITSRVAMEFDTQEALDKYLEAHPNADKSKHKVKDTSDDGGHGEDDGHGHEPGASTGAKLRDHVREILFDDFKDAWTSSKQAYDDIVAAVKPTRPKRKPIVQALQKANLQTKTFFASKRYRAKKMKSLGSSIKNGAKAIAKRIFHAAKDEVKEIGTGVKALRQVLTPGSAPLSKHQKKAVYALGAYAAGAAITATGGGVLMVGAALAKSFSLHVGMKAISHLTDSLFTHFEWGLEASHVPDVIKVLKHIASTHTAGGGEEDGDAMQEVFIQAMVLAVAKVLGEGMSEDEVKSMLSGADDDKYEDVGGLSALDKLKEKGDSQEDKSDKSDKSDKEAALRQRVTKLAYTRPDLRPHLLPVLVR